MGDTSEEAAAVQLSIQRKLSGADRLTMALEMSVMARELAATRLRRRHPEWSGAEVRRELLRYAFRPDILPPPLR